MSAPRLITLLALALWLAGCATYPKGQRYGNWSYTYTRFASSYWWAETISLKSAQIKATGDKTTVAIIGTGVLNGHAGLGTILPGVRSCVNPPDGNTNDKTNGHGTQLAGIAVGKNTGMGDPGVAFNAALVPIKVDCGGGVSTKAFTDGVDAAIAKSPDVILIALGGYPPDVETFLGDRLASTNGSILFVVASAWDPAAGPLPDWTKRDNALVVAAMTLDADPRDRTRVNTRAEIPYDARRGDLFAPGREIGTTDIDPDQYLMNGTSPASAMVAGCALLVKEKSGIKGAGLKRALIDKADKVEYVGRRLNCNAAVP